MTATQYRVARIFHDQNKKLAVQHWSLTCVLECLNYTTGRALCNSLADHVVHRSVYWHQHLQFAEDQGISIIPAEFHAHARFLNIASNSC